ncbi:acyltransferase [Spirosoma sp. SC4-14]|uniref:acyltransferase family protein n=1 Tax=Spirosoma sp. SC4-14 TaxID=3128900 RepID=UPI0030D3831F
MKTSRIISLDGLRALSISMVLLAHGSYTMPGFISNSPIYVGASNGALGVKIFFVISGYLITRLLLAEADRTGYIHIRKFYLRRFLRIFPVFYCYIAVVLILKWFFIPDILSSYYPPLFAGLYLWNYQDFFNYPIIPTDKGYWFFGHCWSLSMEEQFYLLWPFIMSRYSRSTVSKICLVLIIGMPLLRAAYYVVYPGMHLQLRMMLHTGGDAILMGCLGALLETKLLQHRLTQWLLKNPVFVGLCVVMLFFISPKLAIMYKGSYGMTIGMSLDNALILILLLWSVHVSSVVATFLNNRWLVRLGMMSYSIYIWQQLFLTYQLDGWATKFPQNFIVVAGVAYLSYRLIEKPILDRRQAIETWAQRQVMPQLDQLKRRVLYAER